MSGRGSGSAAVRKVQSKGSQAQATSLVLGRNPGGALGISVLDGEEVEVDLNRPIPERRFEDEALVRILAKSTKVRCECPPVIWRI